RTDLEKSQETRVAGKRSDLRASERGSIQPGQSALVQIRLEEPMTALPGDRFIIRSYSPQITIGGGVIIDGLPQKHRIRDTDARKRLEQLEHTDAAEQMAIFIEMAEAHGISDSELASRTGATDEQIQSTTSALVTAGRVLEVTSAPLLLLSTESYND